MAVGLPAQATLDASIFFTVFKSITIHGSYVGTRQDALEAIEIAATGHVKCTYKKLGLKDIEKYVHSCFNFAQILTLIIIIRVYEDMTAGRIAGRIVLDVNEV